VACRRDEERVRGRGHGVPGVLRRAAAEAAIFHVKRGPSLSRPSGHGDGREPAAPSARVRREGVASADAGVDDVVDREGGARRVIARGQRGPRVAVGIRHRCSLAVDAGDGRSDQRGACRINPWGRGRGAVGRLRACVGDEGEGHLVFPLAFSLEPVGRDERAEDCAKWGCIEVQGWNLLHDWCELRERTHGE